MVTNGISWHAQTLVKYRQAIVEQQQQDAPTPCNGIELSQVKDTRLSKIADTVSCWLSWGAPCGEVNGKSLRSRGTHTIWQSDKGPCIRSGKCKGAILLQGPCKDCRLEANKIDTARAISEWMFKIDMAQLARERIHGTEKSQEELMMILQARDYRTSG